MTPATFTVRFLMCWVGLGVAETMTALPPPESHALTVVTFGDSTTAPRKNTTVYTEQLAQRFASSSRPIAWLNRGVPNDTTESGRARFGAAVLAARPDLVVLQFGINDANYDVWKNPPATTPGVSLARYEENLRFMIAEIRATGALVILMTPNQLRWTPKLLGLYSHPPYDPTNQRGMTPMMDPYVDTIRRLAKEVRVPLVDVYALYDRWEQDHGQSCGALLSDGMHPNTAGHTLTAAALAPLIAQALNGKGVDPAAWAKAALEEILVLQESWAQIHAAEALLAVGEARYVRSVLEAKMPEMNRLIYRVGVWRVLVRAAQSDEEREKWISRIEQTALDRSAPDRVEAIESLCKLKRRLPEAALAQARIESAASGPNMPVFLWALGVAGESDAIKRLGLALSSGTASVRRGAAYVLRWLRVNDPTVLQELAVAADHEPSTTEANAFLASAAVALLPGHVRGAVWREKIWQVLATGSGEDKFEVSHALLPYFAPEDVSRITPLLTNVDSDARIAAATLILRRDGAAVETEEVSRN